MRVITGSARGVRLKTPDGQDTRPTAERVKEAAFSMVQFEIEGRRVLDLFAGTGQLGIEALSRGAKSAVFVEQRKDAMALVRENLKRTRLASRAETILGDAISFLSCCAPRSFDLILLDPPYATNSLKSALNCISEIDILSEGGIILCERPSESPHPGNFPGLETEKDHRYGKTILTLYRRIGGSL